MAGLRPRYSAAVGVVKAPGRALALVGGGIALCLALVWLSGRWLAELLFEFEPTDPLSFAVAPLLLLGVAVLASAVPARRAA